MGLPGRVRGTVRAGHKRQVCQMVSGSHQSGRGPSRATMLARMNPLEALDVFKRRVVPAMRERGPLTVLVTCVRWVLGYVLGRLGLSEASKGSFTFEGRRIPYFRHTYHYTWLGERNVEVALAQELLDAHRGEKILEVGNVTPHYLADVDHTVVDKYEVAPGVLNLDVVDIDLPEGSFDLVVAISTLEHVGLDEDVVDPEKPARAVALLKSLVRPGGTLWVTHPVGYNPTLDADLRNGAIAFDSLKALRRSPTRNVWRQVDVDDVWDAEYDRFLFAAHGIVVAEYQRPLV
ncbi:class I SAM-dependent methyltransferase [Nocardioides jishulii]|uniref:Class I SAM-dependent methyltransferase n=2 Tax=Nocardioides jishulii TaxID=2575440 RepID=A0A4U2YL74_9ACTN|nr:class I SAM-dependent methyltransferase [Nocardioides jishulii]